QLSQHLKQNVLEIVKSREQIKHISDNLVDGFVYQIDSGDENNVRKFTYISAGVDKILGISPEKVYENAFHLYHMVDSDDTANFMRKEKEAIDKASTFNAEVWFLTASGHKKCLLLNSTPNIDDKKHIIWDGIAIDITSKKEAEADVQKTLKRLEEVNFIINHSPAYAIIWKAEENWPVAFVSENISALLGYSAEDFMKGKIVFADIVYHDDLERMNEEIEKNIKIGLSEYNQEYRVVGKNGDIHWVDDRTWIKKDEQGNIIYFQGILLDVSARKFAEEKQAKLTEQLLHSQKMDAIGQLAGGVAHDFNNVLSAIMGSAEMLKLSSLPQEKQLDFINVIITAAKRAGDLTQKLLTFSRKGIKASTPVDCLKIVSDTISLLKHTLNKNISISMESRTTQHTIIGDDSLLQNALVNMGINASHAMPEGGSLIFTLENLELDEEYCHLSPFDIKPGTYLEISVRDTGIGMPPEILSRVFEPFFTTKDQGKGTGLGLAMVYGMVQEHGGAITVYSELGNGTVFHIYLPVVSDISRPADLHEETIYGTGTILLIDDEELIRITASAILSSLGYQVILAENGEEGVLIFKENMGKIDLIILDMIMPVMGGRETFYHIREISESVPVIIASGFAKEEDMKALKKQGVGGFLQKPFRRAELAEMVATKLMTKGDN
ncbi:MAG: PAS domain-containing protein, partial [Candidatus Cloacimonetes bacterium]|nr:PAS domain-containing protein [Candidatus Cloacimonadota bacterium]